MSGIIAIIDNVCSCSIAEKNFPWGKMNLSKYTLKSSELTLKAEKQPDPQRKRFWSNIAVIYNQDYRSTSQRNWDRAPKLYLSDSLGHS